MTIKMNSNFINYSDFLNIVIETFDTAPKELVTTYLPQNRNKSLT